MEPIEGGLTTLEDFLKRENFDVRVVEIIDFLIKLRIKDFNFILSKPLLSLTEDSDNYLLFKYEIPTNKEKVTIKYIKLQKSDSQDIYVGTFVMFLEDKSNNSVVDNKQFILSIAESKKVGEDNFKCLLLSAFFDCNKENIPSTQFFLTKNNETIMVFKLPDPKMIKFKIKKGSDQHFSTVNLDSVKDIVDNFLQERISYIITSQSTDNFGLPSNYFSFYQTILSTLYNTTLLNCNMTFGILGSEWFEKDKKECVFKNLCEFKEHFGVVNKKEGFLMFAILFDRHTSIMVLDLKENKLYLFDSSWYHQQKLNSPFPNIPVNEITLINEVPLQKHPYGTCFYFGLAFIEELLQINDEEILRKKLKFRNTRAELSLKTAIRTSCFIDKYLNGGIQDQEKPEIIINPQEQISYLSSDYITITCGDNKVLLRRDQSQKTCVEKTYILVLAYVTYKQYHLADFYYSSKSQAMRILRDQSTDSESISLEKEEACCKCKSCC